MRDAIAELTRQGATIVDPAEHSEHRRSGSGAELPRLAASVRGRTSAKGKDAELLRRPIKYGMKRDFGRVAGDCSATPRR